MKIQRKRKGERVNLNPEPFNESPNRYVVYTAASCVWVRKGVSAAGSSFVLVKDGKVILERCKPFVGKTQHQAEIIAVISAVKSVPEGTYLDVYTASDYCIEAMMFRCSGTKKNLDLLDFFAKSVGHLADMRMHHESITETSIINQAKRLSLSARHEAEAMAVHEPSKKR